MRKKIIDKLQPISRDELMSLTPRELGITLMYEQGIPTVSIAECFDITTVRVLDILHKVIRKINGYRDGTLPQRLYTNSTEDLIHKERTLLSCEKIINRIRLGL